MITYETDELKKSNRKNINTASKNGRTAKIYTVNIEGKRLLKQRREKTLQNAKGKRPAEEYFLTALKASRKTYNALKNTQKRKKSENGLINDENMNIAMIANNINNLEIVGDNEVNATTNAKNADNESVDTDNINTAETEIDKSEDIAMSDNNDDNTAISDKDSPPDMSGEDNTENSELGENSTKEVPSPLIYGRKMTQIKSKPQKGTDLSGLNPCNLHWVIHVWIKIPQVKQKVIYLILLMCAYMNSFLKVHQTLKIYRVLRRIRY